MDYREMADALAAEIARGTLRPGERLPTQRRFARAHGIAVSTASRVYAELARRGLVVGEVGRGTFVRTGEPPPEIALAEPRQARVDLELNFPVLPEHPAMLAESLRATLRPDAMAAAVRPVGTEGTARAREVSAGLLARGGWAPRPDDVLFAGTGRQAIAAVLAALVPPGERLGVEALTYPVVKGIAARLSIQLVPLAMDDQGVVPDAVSGSLRALYLQPALHNPLGVSMSAQRRAAIADVLRDREIPLVEDGIYGFLHDDPPVSALVPELGVLVDSLSKRLAPGLTLGFAVVPPRLHARVAAANRSGGWAAQRFALEAARGWIADGTAARLQADKRADAQARQALLAERLAGFAVHADPRAYHCWWVLPEHWRAETFVAAAARHGIAVTPAAAFAVGAARAPHAVRLALAAPPLPVLAAALGRLADIARGADDSGGDSC
ncbi:DNA-binding transcriptional regulator, MocR family, contains an aminotransferase domain [Actinokineospora iranica]|uniref:DNA-binding transcriptional regulator, MocR family, contains an aminotransferase domain n=2 Tax=Actinokineospora iranica TaxID=1271860 RepID=A0A1G6TL62_9PSEU|nr:DNA-binding transcriptional regulator, MocR family, contains an aminotransferase domain [Actinokineospora iranica]